MDKMPVGPWAQALRKGSLSVLFLLLLASNILLAHGPFLLKTKLWIGLFLFLLPYGWALGQTLRAPQRTGGILDSWPGKVPSWAWVLVLILAIVPRAAELLFPAWPLPDEGISTLMSLELSREWTWHFFFTQALVPPAFNWLSSLWLEVFPGSFLSIRWLTFLLSLSALGLAALACRATLKGPLAWVVWAFFGLGFWPLLTFHLLLFMGLTTVMQPLVFWLWARARSLPPLPLRGAALGAALGFGFWCSTPWLLVTLAVLLPWVLRRKRIGERPLLFWTLGPLGLFALGYAVCFLSEDGLRHILWLISHEALENSYGRLRSLLSNWTILLWEGIPRQPFGPSWGGLLNPLEGALFCLGILGLLKHRKDPVARWVLGASFLFLLPGLLTSAYESFHNILFLPMVALVSGIGACLVLKEWKLPWRLPFLGLLLGVNAILNGIHAWKAFHQPGGEEVTSQKAAKILEGCRQQWGPGYLLWGLSSDGLDPVLAVATYPYNAAQDPGREGPARWACVKVNSNYRHYLDRRFPGARWVELGPDTFWRQGEVLLGIWSWDPGQSLPFPTWLGMDRLWQDLEMRTLFDHRSGRIRRIEAGLKATKGAARGDPLLCSLYWEKRIYLTRASLPPIEQVPSIKAALQEGLRAPHLLTALGLLESSMGKEAEAMAHLREAANAPGGRTQAPLLLRGLERKGSQP